VTTILKALLAAVAGLALGIWATAALLAGGGPFDMVSLGPWNVAAKAGAIDADPYTRAALERSGEVPIALGEGLQMIARVDDAGRPLLSNCVYRVGPHVPAARYWTLGVVDLKGFPIDNPAERYVFRSSEILRDADGAVAIYVSGNVHAGNWLPVGRGRRFALVLRLYDSPLSATAGGIEKAAAPNIVRESCV
jgi:hypothetical protein